MISVIDDIQPDHLVYPPLIRSLVSPRRFGFTPVGHVYFWVHEQADIIRDRLDEDLDSLDPEPPREPVRLGDLDPEVVGGLVGRWSLGGGTGDGW